MALALSFRSIIAAVAVWSVHQAAAALLIAVGGMIVAGGTAIHHATNVIAAGAMIATIVAIAFISSRVVAARITKKKESSDFAALFYTGSVRVPERLSSCGNTSDVIGANTSITSPSGAKLISHLALSSAVRTE
jgi:hypothetical protein